MSQALQRIESAPLALAELQTIGEVFVRKVAELSSKAATTGTMDIIYALPLWMGDSPKLQILNTIILFVAVFMMHLLRFQERASDMSSHYQSVLKYIALLASCCHYAQRVIGGKQDINIPGRMNVFSTLPHPVFPASLIFRLFWLLRTRRNQLVPFPVARPTRNAAIAPIEEVEHYPSFLATLWALRPDNTTSPGQPFFVAPTDCSNFRHLSFSKWVASTFLPVTTYTTIKEQML